MNLCLQVLNLCRWQSGDTETKAIHEKNWLQNLQELSHYSRKQGVKEALAVACVCVLGSWVEALWRRRAGEQLGTGGLNNDRVFTLLVPCYLAPGPGHLRAEEDRLGGWVLVAIGGWVWIEVWLTGSERHIHGQVWFLSELAHAGLPVSY